MGAIGVRELKERTSQVLRRVRERGEEIDVTYHGRVVARLVPASPKRPRRQATTAAWATLDRVAREIDSRWSKGRSATETVREGRRALG
jgi:prevent-host-death family protein